MSVLHSVIPPQPFKFVEALKFGSEEFEGAFAATLSLKYTLRARHVIVPKVALGNASIPNDTRIEGVNLRC